MATHTDLETYHIHINGVVQGVGFRPKVYQLANTLQLKGCVKNGRDGVHIYFGAQTQELANLFFDRVKTEAPAPAKIVGAMMQRIPPRTFIDFSVVVEEDDSEVKQVLISPDKALCPKCRSELHDKNNRRYRYAFITCTQCGPRYSILNRLPFERPYTTMNSYHQCKKCNLEYRTITDRRFISQTNSCPTCGIALSLFENETTAIAGDRNELLKYITDVLQKGKIVAVKSIGGYLLLTDAGNKKAVQRLREAKRRPSKPLAVLYPSLELVEKNFHVTPREMELLQSEEAPIVLLRRKGPSIDLATELIAPRLTRIGVMLPYNPLLELIASDLRKPLVATSANLSGSPILYKDEDALANLFDVADYVVVNDREIVIPQDDSVVQVTNNSGEQILLRRSRGYAPAALFYRPSSPACVVATGAFLKCSFTLSVRGNVFVSQFLGSSERYESQLIYRSTLDHWLRLYDIEPKVIVTDLHPNYFSHVLAGEMAARFNATLKFVQHHEAHFAAVLAENNLLESGTPVLGVIWDGTGLGADGKIWGGEFFKYEDGTMHRSHHLAYFPVIAGDKFALEPRIAALCLMADDPQLAEGIKEKFSAVEWFNYHRLMEETSLHTSSMGRVADAVASLLGLCDKQSYEGEAAMYLQALAETYVAEFGFAMDESYFNEDVLSNQIPASPLVRAIQVDKKHGLSKEYIAAKFHYSLARLVDTIAARTNASRICFSGGVFQNALLVDWIQEICKDKYKLYFHQHLSPNDENISFGQLVYIDRNIRSLDEIAHDQKKVNALKNETIHL